MLCARLAGTALLGQCWRYGVVHLKEKVADDATKTPRCWSEYGVFVVRAHQNRALWFEGVSC